MIPELCVVKYQSVTKSDSHCIIKSGCKIRHSNGTSSRDELPDNDKRKTTRLAPCVEKTKWSYMRIKRCLPKSVATDRTAKAKNQRHINVCFKINIM